jgi:hypothetical protein
MAALLHRGVLDKPALTDRSQSGMSLMSSAPQLRSLHFALARGQE